MRLSKESFRKMTGARVATVSTLIVLTVVLVVASPTLAASRPKTVAELALYQGVDRQQILEEGARQEGSLTFYTTGHLRQTVGPLIAAFEKKYPFIKVHVWRASTTKIVPRVNEEYHAGRYLVDTIETSQIGRMLMVEKGILQPYFSPNLVQMDAGTIIKAPGQGVYSAGHYQSFISLGYNTEMISQAEIPKTYHDLLDPKWKGKMPITNRGAARHWIGIIFETLGEEFLVKLSKQKFVLHALSARGLIDMIIAGEYAFSPAVFDSHANKSKNVGAPVAWYPIEPVVTYIGQIMLAKNAPHPYTAMLFIDFDLSKRAGELYKENGYKSPRKDIFVERSYKYTPYPSSTKQYMKWDDLFDRYFMKK
ncbi:ABC transporter substrate-binding protein [Thermodesulfobacteriota bacterium]